ncbi:DUF2336 domain-containing protein [Roseibium sp.]|uniref:DUF2336 domain-containing protein n=1 Tax=Roseibium sp. TaxID=1936156 RepID=UPI003A96A98D
MAKTPKNSRDHTRDEVLLSATELFVSREFHDERDVTLYRELALNLLPQTGETDRRKIACHLVRHPDAPIEVLKVLGHDEDPLTAYPVLRNTADLGPDILKCQAERGPDSLRKAIADRADLTAGIAIAIARNGGIDVIEQLLSRPDVLLDEAMVSALCERPETLQHFGDELIARKVLKGEHLLNHFPRLGKGLRREAIASAELASLIQMTRTGTHKAARPVFKQDVLAKIETCALADGAEAFSGALSYALGLPEDLVRRAVEIDTGETLVICLKALGVTEAVAGRILIRLIGAHTPLAQIRDLLDIFVNISHGAALVLVNRWIGGSSERQADRAATAAHLPLHQETVSPRRTGGLSGNWQEIEEIEELLRFSR